MMLEAGCAGSSRHGLPRGRRDAGRHAAARRVRGRLGLLHRARSASTGIPALVRAVEARQPTAGSAAGGASFDILGGAIDDLAADAAA